MNVSPPPFAWGVGAPGRRAVVLLEVMWDDENVPGQPGYRERAPRHFDINPDNFTGRRLHGWLHGYPGFRTTNACPQLVSAATGRGTPDKGWVRENLALLSPFDLLLICGAVAARTYEPAGAGRARIIELPHPAMRLWNAQGLALVARTIEQGGESARIFFCRLPGETSGRFVTGPLSSNP